LATYGARSTPAAAPPKAAALGLISDRLYRARGPQPCAGKEHDDQEAEITIDWPGR
jgi:hypothetical protein